MALTRVTWARKRTPAILGRKYGKRPAPVILSRTIWTSFGDYPLPPDQKGLTQTQYDAIQAEFKRQAAEKGAKGQAVRLKEALDAAFVEAGFIKPSEASSPEVRPNDLSTQAQKEGPNG